jgi:hypothetical protein
MVSPYQSDFLGVVKFPCVPFESRVELDEGIFFLACESRKERPGAKLMGYYIV